MSVLTPSALNQQIEAAIAKFGQNTAKMAHSSDSTGKKDPAELAAHLALMVDHTLLKADATAAEIDRVCEEARTNGFATVCVNSMWIPRAAKNLQGSSTKPISVVGFPLGAASTASKVFESEQAIRDGAREIDMVISLGSLKAGDFFAAYEDVRAVVEASKPYPVKVILETASLTREQKIAACVISQAAEAAFVKTSTGFGGGGATVEDVALMRAVVGPKMGVKASGGIRSTEDALKMVAAGANRIGASASIGIVTGAQAKSGIY